MEVTTGIGANTMPHVFSNSILERLEMMHIRKAGGKLILIIVSQERVVFGVEQPAWLSAAFLLLFCALSVALS